MKTPAEIAAECVRIAVEQGALRRPAHAGDRASEAPAFLGPTSPLDGDYEYLRSEVENDPGMLDEGRAFGLAHAASSPFEDAYRTEMAERMAAQTAEDFPFDVRTAKGRDRFATVEAAAAWLAQMMPADCEVNGVGFDWDGDVDEDDMDAEIARAIRAALADA